MSSVNYNGGDIITTSLGIDILKHIFQFLDHPLSYFAFSTCSLWYRVGSETCGIEKPNAINLAQSAAHKGYLNLLKYLVSNEKFKTRNNKIMESAAHGHLDCMKYLHEQGWKLKSKFDKYKRPTKITITINAVKSGAVECLKYALDNGSGWNDSVCSTAAQVGSLECLKYAHEYGCGWSFMTTGVAAANGHLDCLKYAHENGCIWNFWLCRAAAGNGHLECLKYAHENGCKWNGSACVAAARGGHLNCLKYAHENGSKWDTQTCINAASGGHLECLKYAHENGCEWDEHTCINAVRYGHLECLKYAHENGCPWNGTCYQQGTISMECVKYLQENGCPHDANSCKKVVDLDDLMD